MNFFFFSVVKNYRSVKWKMNFSRELKKKRDYSRGQDPPRAIRMKGVPGDAETPGSTAAASISRTFPLRLCDARRIM